MKKVLMAEYLEFDGPLKVGSHQYAKLFAENGYEVIWLSPMNNFLYYFKDREGYVRRRKSGGNKIHEISENIKVYSPYSIIPYCNKPILNSKLANKASMEFTIPKLYKVLKDNDYIDVDILWLSNTSYYYLKDKIKYRKMFHRCSDDVNGYGFCKSKIEFERKTMEESDKVFMTGYDLIEKKINIRNDLIYLPNGVQLENFVRDRYECPNEFIKNKRKKCIFVGAIYDWMDIGLIKFCAEKLKEVDFYFIGPINTRIDILEEIKNVYFLGKKKYEDIPNYLVYSDVSIIPFKVNNFTNSITPVKLYEYMSVGLNVVTTNFKEMNYLNSPAYIAQSYEKFCAYIIKAISSKDSMKEKNIAYAKLNTWQERYKTIQKYL